MLGSIEVRFWGVRGSIPSPGPATARIGGNTACVSITLEDDRMLVLDAGTGIRELGKRLATWHGPIHVLLSHAHWDHIQGFPFFAPIYEPHREVTLYATRLDDGLLCALLDQMDGSHFPVTAAALPADLRCVREDELGVLHRAGFDVSRIATNHPGGGFGYRLDHGGHSVVYLTDNELDPPGPKETNLDAFVRFADGADVLIHDAQYVEQDMPRKRGWGHSRVRQATALALAARVRHLVLFHHDPDRTDDEVAMIESEAREQLARLGAATECTAAYEGLVIALGTMARGGSNPRHP